MMDLHAYPYSEQTKQFCFHLYVPLQKEASFFTCFEELLKLTDFG